MRRFAALCCALLLSFGAHAGPKEDAEAAYAQFFAAFTTGNHDKITALFAPDALFYGTGSPDVVATSYGVRAYFTRALSGPAIVQARPLGHTTLMLSDTVAVISGKWQSERTTDGKMVTAGPSRNTVVLHKRGDRWLIVQFHNSPTPKPKPAALAPAPQ
jgi:uncharacterized protein (TIGR02246 family)